MAKTKQKALECPKCQHQRVYHRKRDNTMRCMTCGYEYNADEKKVK